MNSLGFWMQAAIGIIVCSVFPVADSPDRAGSSNGGSGSWNNFPRSCVLSKG